MRELAKLGSLIVQPALRAWLLIKNDLALKAP